MGESVEKLTLELLRALRSDIGEIRQGQRGVLIRLSRLEIEVAGLRDVVKNAQMAVHI